MDINKYSYKGQIKTCDILGMSSLDESDIYEVLCRAKLFKKRKAAGEKETFLSGKTIAVITKGSLPINAACLYTAVSEAGGNIFLFDSQNFLGNLKYLSLTLLNANVSAAVFYGIEEEILSLVAAQTNLPFINAGNNICSPINAANALFTLWETNKKLLGQKVILPETNKSENINSFALAALKCGLDIKLCQDDMCAAIDCFVTERAMQYGEFSHISAPEHMQEADAVFVDFGAQFNAQSLIKTLDTIKSGAVLLCARPEFITENIEDSVSKHDAIIALQARNKVSIFKAFLSLIV